MHSALHCLQISLGIHVFSWPIDRARIEESYVDIWKKKQKQVFVFALSLTQQKASHCISICSPNPAGSERFLWKARNLAQPPILGLYLVLSHYMELLVSSQDTLFEHFYNFKYSLTWKIPFSLHYYTLNLIAFVYISNLWSFFSQYPVLIVNLMVEQFPETYLLCF